MGVREPRMYFPEIGPRLFAFALIATQPTHLWQWKVVQSWCSYFTGIDGITSNSRWFNLADVQHNSIIHVVMH